MKRYVTCVSPVLWFSHEHFLLVQTFSPALIINIVGGGMGINAGGTMGTCSILVSEPAELVRKTFELGPYTINNFLCFPRGEKKCGTPRGVEQKALGAALCPSVVNKVLS